MITLDNGAVCTCDTEGGCAYHGLGPAGVYRKGFEHASDNYNAEKERGHALHSRADRAEARLKSAESDVARFIRENDKLRTEMIELRAALRAMASLVTEEVLKARARD